MNGWKHWIKAPRPLSGKKKKRIDQKKYRQRLKAEVKRMEDD